MIGSRNELALEMTAFCQQAVEKQHSRQSKSRVAKLVLPAVVVAVAVLELSKPKPMYDGWGRDDPN